MAAVTVSPLPELKESKVEPDNLKPPTIDSKLTPLEAQASQPAAEELERSRSVIEPRNRAEEEARPRVENERGRKFEEESRLKTEEEARARAEEETRVREEEGRFRLEVETLRRAAEELARKRAEADLARKSAEERARRRAEVEAQYKMEELALSADVLRSNEEEIQRKIEVETRRRVEEEIRQKIDQERIRAEVEAQIRADETRRRSDEETRIADPLVQRAVEDAARKRAAPESRQFVKDEQGAEERRLGDEEQLRLEQEALVKAAEAIARRRREIETARKKLEDEAQLSAASQLQMRADEEARGVIAEQKRIDNEIRQHAEQEQQRLELRRVKQQSEEQSRQREKQDKKIRAEIEFLLSAEEEQRLRIEAEKRRRAEAEARVGAERNARLVAEDKAERQAQVRAEAEERLCTHERQQESEQKASQLPAQSNSDQVLDTTGDVFEGLPSATIDAGPIEDLWAGLDVAHESEITTANTSSDSQFFKEEPEKGTDLARAETCTPPTAESDISVELLHLLNSEASVERAAALSELAKLGGEVAFGLISRAFDDQSVDVRTAAARALYDFQSDRAASFTRALREGSPERRRSIGAALASSGLAANAIANLTGESREKTYDAFSLLFLMAKAGEVQPLIEAIEEYPNVEARLAVVKLLALSGQPEIVPTFRRLAVRGSLPQEVRSAVMEAIYQISSQAQETTPSAA